MITYHSTKFNESFNQDSSLDSHVQATRNARSRERLGRAVFLADGHQSWHFIFRENNLLTTKVGQRDVG